MLTKSVCAFHVYYNLGLDSSLSGRHITFMQFNSNSPLVYSNYAGAYTYPWEVIEEY